MSEIIIEPRKTFKNISHDIIDFLKKLSYDGYVLAGHCASNIMTDMNIRDLDFFIYKDFINVFKKEFMFENATYKYYSSFIEIKTSTLLINLIYYETFIMSTPYDIINCFDFDYVKSFICSNDLKIHTFNKTLECLATKIITSVPINHCNSILRFKKAIHYGYIFSQNIIDEKKFCINSYDFNNVKFELKYILKTNYPKVIFNMFQFYPLMMRVDYIDMPLNYFDKIHVNDDSETNNL